MLPNSLTTFTRLSVAVLAVGFAILASSGNDTVVAAPPNDDFADFAFGTPTGFTTGTCNSGFPSPSRGTLCDPSGVVWDALGNLYVADTLNGRVLQYDTPLTTDLLPERVFGKPNFTAVTANCAAAAVATATTLCYPVAVAIDASGDLYVADQIDNRILRYDSPLTSDAIADAVYGQVDFSGRSCTPPSASSLCYPSDLAFDPAGNLFVADNGHHRVIAFAATPADTVADRVFGQPDFVGILPNNGGGRSASSMNAPYGVAIDATSRLYVADAFNSRVLAFDAPMTSDSVADYVLGETSFTTHTCVLADPASLCSPNDVGIDADGNVYAHDGTRSATLVFAQPLTTDGIADGLIGSPSYTTPMCNSPIPSASNTCASHGLAFGPGGTLALGNGHFNRVLLYNAPLGTDFIADKVIGQQSVWTSNQCNGAGSVSASSICAPSGVAVDAGGNVYIADQLNNRVLGYNTPLTTDFIADRVFGQNGSFTTNAINAVSADSLRAPHGVAVDAAGNLYISDAGNHRILQYDTPLVNGTTADRVIGQPNFTTANCHNGGAGASSLCGPTGLELDTAGNLYVADYGGDRVLAYNTPLVSDAVADRVFGKPNFTQVFCNAGGLSASTLCAPYGVALDSTGRLYVADSGNARILRYDSPLASDAVADGVLGQANFTSQVCNTPLDADALCEPRGIEIDGSDLYVADYSNHRVVRGTTASLATQVFGQLGSFTSNTPNQGGESARSLVAPREVAVDTAGRLYVVDSGNHRVLVYNTILEMDADAVADATDNCPTIANPGQQNADPNYIDHSPPYNVSVDDKTWANSDRPGDACDLDDDNDGILDADEGDGGIGCAAITNPLLRDTDADRFLDGVECTLGTDPTVFASKPAITACGATTDVDGDKLSERVEYCFYGTDPDNSDSDGDKGFDGAKDGCEAASLNGDRIVNVADMGMLATAITNSAFRVVSVDVNKDGVWNPADQGLVASFISPSGQCPG